LPQPKSKVVSATVSFPCFTIITLSVQQCVNDISRRSDLFDSLELLQRISQKLSNNFHDLGRVLVSFEIIDEAACHVTVFSPRSLDEPTLVNSRLVDCTDLPIMNATRKTNLEHDSPIALMVYQEAILSCLILLSELEIPGHIECDIPIRATCCVEVAESLQITGGDEEVIFTITCNNMSEYARAIS
jgi:hypothetical protein